MKEEDLIIDFKEHQLILYAEKDDHSYGPVQTGSFIAKNYLSDFLEKRTKVDRDLLEKLHSGKISPICYYMEIEELTIAELASRVKLRKSKVVKHLHPVHFENVTIEELQRYADIFNIPVANFFQIITTKQDKYWKPHHVEKLVSKKARIEQIKTNNPFVVVTKIEDK